MAGLYIHIPFCHSKCAYCDFVSRPGCSHDVFHSYIDSLLDEYRRRREEIAIPFTTLYMGGGTPSILPVDELRRLIHGLDIDPTSLAEATIEANPEDVSPEWVSAIRDLGFNRVSMGAQSMIDEELRLIGRRHSGTDVCDAMATLRRGGIDNISLDLIYGLPGQTFESWRTSLDVVAAGLHPKHLSCYLLSYEPGTRLTAMLQAGKIAQADDNLVGRMYDFMTDFTAKLGYEHYEISNFALPGYRAVHNSNYWNSAPYLGLGAGAHSFDGTIRRINQPRKRPIWEYDTIIHPETELDRLNDYIVTSLRTSTGLDLNLVGSRWGAKTAEGILRSAQQYLEKGWLIHSEERLTIPEAHMLMSDAVMRDLLVEEL